MWGYSFNTKNWPLLSIICCSFCYFVCKDVDYKCYHLLLSSFWSQEAHVTDADAKTSPSHLNAKTPTPVPRTKMRARLYSSTHACVRHCLCVNSPQLYLFVWACLLWNAAWLFMRDIPRSNLHEPFKFPRIVLFNTNHVIRVTWLT